ncbi:MAG: homoserine O-succinyltransferase [Alphaproteobacteria bacterium]|nr:homoserine O-succinyltransferase [Alphaproteobacteria bacterium]
MPIKIPDDLPAHKILSLEGVPLITQHDALIQDIRPLKIVILNLMPDKIQTETQLARLLGNSPLQIELSLMKIGAHQSKNTAHSHLLNFYQNWEELQDEYFDGLIITGAPLEHLAFADVTYWQELQAIFDWSLHHVSKVFSICWGAQAALYHFYGLTSPLLPAKRFGIFQQRINPNHQNHSLMRGINDSAAVPVSRHSETQASDINNIKHLITLLDSDEAGPCLVDDSYAQYVYMFNHLEYDSHTLRDEYQRDVAKNKKIDLPQSYFPDNNSLASPVNIWRSTAHLLFRNWIDDVYHSTPFDITKIKARKLPFDDKKQHQTQKQGVLS